MHDATTTDTATEPKRNSLTRRQARLVEDALEEMSRAPGFYGMERREILAAVAERVAPDVPKVTMANLLGAAEALDIELPSRFDPPPAPTAREDRELLLEIAEIIDDLAANSVAVPTEARDRWSAYRARTRGLFAREAGR